MDHAIGHRGPRYFHFICRRAERLLLGSVSTGSEGNDRSDLGVAASLQSLIYASTCLTGELFHQCATVDALAAVRADPRLRRRVARHLRKIEQRAADLVEQYRESVAAVADALAAKRYLTGAEVVAIMEAVDCKKQPTDSLELITRERS